HSLQRCITSFCYFIASATSQCYTLSLHDALPISCSTTMSPNGGPGWPRRPSARRCSRSVSFFKSSNSCSASATGNICATPPATPDRKSTRLNSSHVKISYAVFCLKKKKKQHKQHK